MKQKIIVHPNDSGVIIVNYPGWNGDVNGYCNKYQKIADMLCERGVGAVVRTSNLQVEGVDYEKSVKDVLRGTTDYVLENRVSICGSDTPSIYLMGISAGAGAIAAVAHEYVHQDWGVEKILLIAPSGDAGFQSIKTGLVNYTRDLYIIVGSDDEIVGVGSAEQFSRLAINARVSKLVIVPNCDHQFRGETNGRILSKAPLWAFADDDTFPLPDGGIKLYD